MTEYVLIRHGWAAWKEIPGGRAALTDLVPLSDEGIKRVETTAQRVRAMLPDAVLSSPVTRALQSGHLIARDLGLALHVEPDLHEWLPERSGRWPGRQVFTENLRAMLAAPGDDASAWESLEDVRRRVGAVLARYDHLGTVAVVTHAVVIHALTGLDLPPGGLVRWSPAAGTRVREGEPSAMQDRIVRWPHPLPPVVTAYHLPGAVDVSALDRALTALMVRHDILQCRYVRRNGGTSREQLPDGEIVCPTTPVDSIDAESLNALWAEAATRTEHPGWPLLRAHVLRGDTAILALGIDRAIADPWTVSVLEHDLAALYHADTGHRPVLLPPSAGFIGSSAERSRLRAGPHVPAHADTATWQRRAAVAAVPRTVLDTGRTRSLEDACRAHGGSLFAGVAAAVLTAAARHATSSGRSCVLYVPNRDSSSSAHMAGPLASVSRVRIPPPALDGLTRALTWLAEELRGADAIGPVSGETLTITYADDRQRRAMGWRRVWHQIWSPGADNIHIACTASGLEVACGVADPACAEAFTDEIGALLAAWAEPVRPARPVPPR